MKSVPDKTWPALWPHVWTSGFRPFFILAGISAVIFPLLWALIFSGWISPPTQVLSATQWHAHEMFFGFGMAVLAGFLLTATKNWRGVRGYQGAALGYLALAWIFERIGISWGESWPRILFFISNYVFLVSVAGMLFWTLVSGRTAASFKDNGYFLVLLPMLLVSKYFLLTAGHFQMGVVMVTGLFRLAFLVMLERTVTQFMLGAFHVQILRKPLLDNTIKVLGLVMVFAGLLPPAGVFTVSLVLCLFLSVRFCFWKARLAFQRLDIGIMYLGYLAISLQLLIESLSVVVSIPWVGSLSTHVFTFGAMGLVIPAMIIRISNGHTGRRVTFGPRDKFVLRLMLVAFGIRLIAPQIFPAMYVLWITLSAICWALAFGLVLHRIAPLLVGPRVDEKRQ